jgi:hypothetical protein
MRQGHDGNIDSGQYSSLEVRSCEGENPASRPANGSGCFDVSVCDLISLVSCGCGPFVEHFHAATVRVLALWKSGTPVLF